MTNRQSMDQPPSRAWRRAWKAWVFFCQHAQEQKAFSMQDLHAATQYSLDTIDSYCKKLWKRFLIKQPNGQFTCSQNILDLSWEHFQLLHRQNRDFLVFPHSDMFVPSSSPSLPTDEHEHMSQNVGEPSTFLYHARMAVVCLFVELRKKLSA